MPLRKLSRDAGFGKDRAGEDNGGVIRAVFCSSTERVGNVKCEEIANDRRCVCLERLSGIEDGVVVNDNGEAGGEVGNGSLGEVVVTCNEGIDSK